MLLKLDILADPDKIIWKLCITVCLCFSFYFETQTHFKMLEFFWGTEGLNFNEF